MINPFSDLGKETQNPFLDTRIRIWIFPKKRTLKAKAVLVAKRDRAENQSKFSILLGVPVKSTKLKTSAVFNLKNNNLRANVANGQTFGGNSSKINSAHILMLGRP